MASQNFDEIAFLLRLPRSLHKELTDRAEADDRTMASMVRVAIRYYLDNTKPLVRPEAP